MYCRLSMVAQDVRVTVRAKKAFAEAYIYNGLSMRLLAAGWYRVR